VKLEKYVVTGSLIKRLEGEGALPVVTLTPDELELRGIASAEQMLMELNINSNGLDNLASNADVVAGQQRGNNGATSANLRMQGAGATLVLLNGRRVSSHGLNGGVVDLNQIPFAAIERVEVLKDGASAIYGTDAVGGVINFILKTNYQGLAASAAADVTQDGGGNIFRYSLVGGWGDLDRDKFNLMTSLSLSDSKQLRGDQRDFVNTFQVNRGLSPDTRGTPVATLFAIGTLNSVLSRDNVDNAGRSTGPADPQNPALRVNGINYVDLPNGPGYAGLDGMGPYDEVLWASPASKYGSAWDTGRAAVLQQPLKSTTLVARATGKLGEHYLALELAGSKTESAKRFSNLQMTPNTTTQQLRFPRNPTSQVAYDAVFDRLLAAFPGQILESQRGQSLAYRWRCIECGPREIKTDADTTRWALTAEGPFFGGWDYKAGVLQATSDAKSVLGGGYYFRGTTGTGASDGAPGIVPALNSGRINVFLLPGQTQSADGLAALEEASARGVVLFGGKFTLNQTDVSVSGPLFKLPGGSALAALGVDVRTEKYRFNGDERDPTLQRIIVAAPFDQTNVLLGAKRDVTAFYGELLLPVVKGVELTAAVRQDDYSGFGKTTNPKVSGLWKPSDQFLVRGSYSTGFRVPTFNQLYNGASSATFTGATLVNPATCPTGRVDATRPGCESIRPLIVNGGKEDLGPEEAKMSSVGFVWEPMAAFSVGLDWWSIKREGTIQILSLTQLVDNFSLLRDRFAFAADGSLLSIDQRWVNAGETETSGVEVSLKSSFSAMGARWTAALEGTYLLKKRSRVLPTVPFGASEIGQFSFAGDLGLRWKHNAAIGYKRGDWSATFSQLFRAGYNDQVLPGVSSGRVSPPDWKSKVDSYTTYNVGVSWTGIKGLTLTGVVKNLLDTDPPFAITYDSNFGSGSSWEPRVADPRGRAFVVTAEYRF
jgi:iron complex outermembrane receptor protein